MSSIIANKGSELALEWSKKIVRNFARDPKGNDRDQVKAIASGQGDIAIVNSYYIGLLQSSLDSMDRKVGESVKVFFPNQSENDRGAHVNISGGGVVKFSKNKELATDFLEFLVTEEAQVLYGDVNFEYPINNKSKLPYRL